MIMMNDIFLNLMFSIPHNNLSFFPERMKIEKVANFLTNLHNKKEYTLRNLKQALNHRLFF